MSSKPRKQLETLYTSAQFRPYVAALGQLALAWNGLHETLSCLFCTIIQAKPENQLFAIWHAVKSDRMQRDMLKAAVMNDTRGAVPITYVDDVVWLCVRTDVLEEERNNALHSPLWAYQRSHDEVVVMPMIGLGHVRAKKLFEKNILSEFRWCRDRAIDLATFAFQIDQTFSDYTLPSPDRPLWPTCQATNAKKPRRPAQTVKRPHPPRSSQA